MLITFRTAAFVSKHPTSLRISQGRSMIKVSRHKVASFSFLALLLTPVLAFAGCPNPNPSTPDKTYTCVCGKWEPATESSWVTVCGSRKLQYKTFLYDEKLCISTIMMWATYSEVKGSVDDDCSSYTDPESRCCVSELHHSYVLDPATGRSATNDYGATCDKKYCPRGQLQDIVRNEFPSPTPTPKR